MTDKKEEQEQIERKPSHKVFLEMIKELICRVKDDPVIFKMEREDERLSALLEAVKRSDIPEKKMPEFVAELQKLADSESDYGFGRKIRATAGLLSSMVSE